MKLTLDLSPSAVQDLINIETGLFYPLKGFMTSHDYHSVVDRMTLSNGSIWTIPITLDVNHAMFLMAADTSRLYFTFGGREIGFMKIEDCFRARQSDVRKVYGTEDLRHPGVGLEAARNEYRIGGATTLLDRRLMRRSLLPEKTRKIFRRRGWKTIAGFQTRNPIHNAHEYIQRACLERCDAIFINPTIGWKQPNDFSEQAIRAAYATMIRDFYPAQRVHFAFIKMPTRYAGPRDAVFHAILRRNLGCTHFVIGRDHGGVGGYYGHYEAHDLARRLQSRGNLGIELLLFKEPYHCLSCGMVVTERTCGCDIKNRVLISGGKIRKTLSLGEKPDKILMRPEIAMSVIRLGKKMFV